MPTLDTAEYNKTGEINIGRLDLLENREVTIVGGRSAVSRNYYLDLHSTGVTSNDPGFVGLENTFVDVRWLEQGGTLEQAGYTQAYGSSNVILNRFSEGVLGGTYHVQSTVPICFRGHRESGVISEVVYIGHTESVGACDMTICLPTIYLTGLGLEQDWGFDAQPEVIVTINGDAADLIEEHGLGAVLDEIRGEITGLLNLANVAEVTVEKRVDPEIEDLVTLSVTVWLTEASPKDASLFWKLLRIRTNGLRDRLSAENREKLRKWISIGVDIE